MDFINRKYLALFLFAVIGLFLGGCRELQVSQAKEQMQTTYDSVMGLREDDVIARLGAPQDVKQITEHIKVFYYNQSYGTRSNAYANANRFGAYGSGQSWEAYDQAQVIIKDGVADSWKGYVQR